MKEIDKLKAYSLYNTYNCTPTIPEFSFNLLSNVLFDKYPNNDYLNSLNIKNIGYTLTKAKVKHVAWIHTDKLLYIPIIKIHPITVNNTVITTVYGLTYYDISINDIRPNSIIDIVVSDNGISILYSMELCKKLNTNIIPTSCFACNCEFISKGYQLQELKYTSCPVIQRKRWISLFNALQYKNFLKNHKDFKVFIRLNRHTNIDNFINNYSDKELAKEFIKTIWNCDDIEIDLNTMFNIFNYFTRNKELINYLYSIFKIYDIHSLNDIMYFNHSHTIPSLNLKLDVRDSCSLSMVSSWSTLDFITNKIKIKYDNPLKLIGKVIYVSGFDEKDTKSIKNEIIDNGGIYSFPIRKLDNIEYFLISNDLPKTNPDIVKSKRLGITVLSVDDFRNMLK